MRPLGEPFHLGDRWWGGWFAGGRPDGAEWVARGLAGPDGQIGEGDRDAPREVFDSQPLRGVMAGGDHRDAEGLGLDTAMEAGLACEQDVGAGAGGIPQEPVAGATGEGDPQDL